MICSLRDCGSNRSSFRVRWLKSITFIVLPIIVLHLPIPDRIDPFYTIRYMIRI